MKILLINPPIYNIIETEMPMLIRQNEGVFPPLGLLYIASYLNKNADCSVEVLDSLAEKMRYEEIEQFIRNYRPDIVGINAHTHNLIDVILIADIVKKIDKRIHVCLGGPHVSVFPEESINIDSVDFAVPGEGEISFAELVKAIREKKDLKNVRGILFKESGKIIETGIREDIKNLDNLPFPVRFKPDYKKYYSILGSGNIMTTMASSRGCPYECVFCSTPKGPYRARSPENVVDEMEECLNLGIKEVHFIDDTFNADPNRVIKICEEIKRRQLKIKWSFRGRVDKVTKQSLINSKEAGCYRIHLGVETSTDEGLAELKKDVTVRQIRQVFKWTRELGINTAAYFLIGCPHERTRSDVMRTINFSKEIDPDFALFNILTPYPSTELYEDGLRKGIIRRDFWKEFVSKPRSDFQCQFWQERFSKKELLCLLSLAYKKFYLRPRFILKMLSDSTNPGMFIKRTKTGLRILGLSLKK